jgi:chromosome segregation ATPase
MRGAEAVSELSGFCPHFEKHGDPAACVASLEGLIATLRSALAREKDRVAALEAEQDAAHAKIGEAEELLGELGAGGSAAGLVPAIHNLVAALEADNARLRRELDEAWLARDELARERRGGETPQ